MRLHRSKMATRCTILQFNAKTIPEIKQDASSKICVNLDPYWIDRGNICVRYIYLTRFRVEQIFHYT